MDKYQEIKDKYNVRSNKILIKYFEGEEKKISESGLLLPEGAAVKREKLEDRFDEHLYQGEVILIGSRIQIEEPDIKIGCKVILRNMPAINEACLLKGRTYFAIGPESILCIEKL